MPPETDTVEQDALKLSAEGTPVEQTSKTKVVAPAGENELVAYRVSNRPAFKLVRAPLDREWMDNSRERFAYRCLPLLIANQSGWLVLNSVPFRASWNGGWDKGCMAVEALDGRSELPALTHFGEGVLTFHMPWLFRTPPGWNLWVHGIPNQPKDGIVALEGVVETDWAMATFTMNWKFTARNMWVTFEKDEPICMLTPFRRGDLESLQPVERDLSENPELQKVYNEWSVSREKFIKDLNKPGSDAQAMKWEKDYFRGLGADGKVMPQHQTRVALKEFKPIAKPKP